MYPLLVEVLAKAKICPGVTEKYSPPVVELGMKVPTPPAEVGRVPRLSIEMNPANWLMTRICCVAGPKAADLDPGPTPVLVQFRTWFVRILLDGCLSKPAMN
jgi:hypothetical protein